jgi:hypothetical protein
MDQQMDEVAGKSITSLRALATAEAGAGVAKR